MTMPTFPPSLPARMQRFLEIEVVDADTIKIKKKPGGEVIKTVTRSEFESAVEPLWPHQFSGA